MTWFTWTNMELFANVTTAICIFLAGRNNVHTWWTGIVACIAFMFVFYDAKLYADTLLQVFFVVTGFIGWMNWQANRKLGVSGEQTPIRSIVKENRNTFIGYWVMAVFVACAYGWILHKFTDAYAPWIDSTVLALSVMAQLLLMKRYKENWLVWLAVNTLAVPLFWSRELYLTSVLYGFFWINAVISMMNWNKIYKEQTV